MNSEPADAAVFERLGQHVDRYQQVIARMADSSLRIKALAATAVGALVTLAVQQRRAGLLLVAVLLVVALALLDAYYLAIERGLREESAKLVEAVVAGSAGTIDLFTVRQPEGGPSACETLRSLSAPATAAFYAVAGAVLALGWALS